CSRGAAGVVVPFRFVEGCPELLEPAPVRGPRARVENGPGVADGSGGRTVVAAAGLGDGATFERSQEITGGDVLARPSEQIGDVVETLGVVQAAQSTPEGERPVVALVAKGLGRHLGRRLVGC